MGYDVEKTEDEWRAQLTPAEYRVLREAGTERPGTSSYEHDTTVGVYECRACGAELFRSEHKFDAHCGWPAFYTPLAEDRVELLSDRTMGMVRTEVRCARCGSHLGHVFEGEGFATPTDQRYCINGISLMLQPEDSTADTPTEAPGDGRGHDHGRAKPFRERVFGARAGGRGSS